MVLSFPVAARLLAALLFTLAALAAPASAQNWTVRTVEDDGTPITTIDQAEALLDSRPTVGVDAPPYIDYNGPFPGVSGNDFAVEATGTVYLNGAGSETKTFYIDSDDGFRLRLNGVVIAEYVGVTGSSNTQTASLMVREGDVLRLTYFQAGGGARLTFRESSASGPLVGGSFIRPTPLSAPGLNASRDLERRVRLTWDAVGATGVQRVSVYRRALADGAGLTKVPGTLVASAPAATGVLDDDTARPMQRYEYCIERDGVETVSCAIGQRAIRPVEGLTATTTGAEAVALSWRNLTELPSTQLRVYRRTLEAGEAVGDVPFASGDRLADALSGTATSYRDVTAVPDQAYAYGVVAVAEGAESAAARVLGVRVSVPAVATLAAGDGTDPAGVLVRWSLGEPFAASGFDVYREVLAGQGTADGVRAGDAVLVGTVSVDGLVPAGEALSFRDDAVEADDYAEYCVVTVADGGSESAPVCDAGSRTGLLPPTAVAATTDAFDDRIEVTWADAGPDETGYVVRRRCDEARDGGTCPADLAGPYAEVGRTVANATRYEDATARQGVTYAYEIAAITAAGAVSAAGDGQRATGRRADVLAPEAPAASDGTYEDRVEVTWQNPSTTVMTFQVYRQRPDAASELIALLDPTATRFSDGDVTSDQAAAYCVSAYTVPATTPEAMRQSLRASVAAEMAKPAFDAEGALASASPLGALLSSASATESARACDTGHNALRPPTGVAASDAASDDDERFVRLTWTDASGAEAGYRVYRWPAARTAASAVVVGRVGPNRTGFLDRTAVPGTRYTYAVRAYDQRGPLTADALTPDADSFGGRSRIAAADGAPVAQNAGRRELRAASRVAASDGRFETQVEVTWTDNSAVRDGAGYRVYRWSATGGADQPSGATVVCTTGPTDTRCVDTTFTAADYGVSYRYRVVAFDAYGEALPASGRGDRDTGGTVVLAPVALSASQTYPDKIVLAWSDVSAVNTSYTITRDGVSVATGVTDGGSYTDASPVADYAGHEYCVQAVAGTAMSAAACVTGRRFQPGGEVVASFGLDVTASSTPTGVGLTGQFGQSLSVDDEAIVTGAPADATSGTAYFYRRTSNGGWENHQSVNYSNQFTRMGASVAVDGDRALVGAPGGVTITGDRFAASRNWSDNSQCWPGASSYGCQYDINAWVEARYGDGGVYVYSRSDGQWVLDGVLRHSTSRGLGPALVTPADLAGCFHVDLTGNDLVAVLSTNSGVCTSERFTSLTVKGEARVQHWSGGGNNAYTLDFTNGGAGRDGNDSYLKYNSGGNWFMNQGGYTPDDLVHEFGEVVALDGAWAFASLRRVDEGVTHYNYIAYARNGSGVWEEKNYGEADGRISAMAVDGEWLAVGIQGSTRVDLYQYDLGSSTWTKRTSFAESGVSNFGASVALHGDRLAVGGYGLTTVVYRRSGTTWTEEQRLTTDGADAEHSFGSAVAMGEDDEGVPYLIVGDDQDRARGSGSNGGAGAATVYTLRGGTWQWLGKLLPGADGDNLGSVGFGRSVGLVGNEPVVGAHGHSVQAGALYFGRLGVGPEQAVASDGTYDNQIQIRWADRSSIEDGFRVYRSPADGGDDYQLIATVGADATIYTDADAPPGSAFEYCVTAYATDPDGSNFRESPRTCDVGWRPADGAISGRIASSSGAGVEGALVCLAPPPNRGLLFDGQGGEARTRELGTLPAAFTVEAWVKRGRTGVDEMFLGHGTTQDSQGLHVGFRANGAFTAAFWANDINVQKSAFGEDYDERGWNHWAVTVDGASRTVYLNGTAVGQGTGSDDAYAGTGAFLIGRGPINPFQGQVDEVRLWTGVRTAAQVADAMGRALSGAEAGLLAYWPLDQTEGLVAPDVSETAAHLLYAGGVYAGEGSPGLDACQVTDVDGTYAYSGLRYGEGTTFSVRPQADGRSFQPGSRSVSLSPESPVQNQVDFTDISAFTFAGRVTLGTGTAACAADSVGVYVDGDFQGTTRADGTYAVSVQPTTGGATRTLELRREGTDLAFEPALFELVADQNRSDLDAAVTTTRTLGGFAGGGCARRVGTVTIRVRTEDGCFDRTYEVDQDFEIVGLAPQEYLVDVVGVALAEGSALSRADVLRFYDGLGTQRIDLTDGDGTLDVIYRAPIEVVVAGLPTPIASCATGLVAGGRTLPNVPVIGEYERLDLTVQVQERYGPGEVCPLEGAEVRIFDGFADAEGVAADTTDANGVVRYRTFGRSPSTTAGAEVDGVDRSYQKSLSASVAVPGRGTVTETVWAVVEGYRERTSEFVSATTTEIPLMVLHDPPGSDSYSYVEEGATSCSVVGNLRLDASAVGADLDLTFGLKTSVGLGVQVDMGAGYRFQTRTLFGRERGSGSELEVCATTTERVATLSDPGNVGEDVYVGTALNLVFALADDLRVDAAACRVDFSERLATDLDRAQPFATTYVYGATHIRDTLIPQLETLAGLDSTAVVEGDANGDGEVERLRLAAAADNWRRHLTQNDEHVDAAFASGAATTNRSFSGGTEYEWSHTSDSLHTRHTSTDVFVTSENTVGGVLTVLGYDLLAGIAFDIESHWVEEEDTSEGTSRTVGYVMGDSDAGDAFSVDVGTDPAHGTPVFRTRSGRSSNPWEANTLRRDWPEIAITPPVRRGVDPAGPAVFTVNLTNRSESRETRVYELDVARAANPHAAVLSITGDPIEGETFTMQPDQTLSVTLAVGKGPGETYDYDDLALLFYPPAEKEIWLTDTRKTSVMIDTARVSVSFTPPCSPVSLLRPLAGWAVNADAPGARVSLMADGFALDGTDAQRVGFEYRRGDGPWTLIHEADSYSGTSLEHDWEPPGDGAYHVRAFTGCRVATADGTAFAHVRTDPANGVVDRVRPQVLGAPQPADGSLGLGDDVTLRVTEPLGCASATTVEAGGYRALGLRTADGAPVEADAVCDGREVTLVPRDEGFWAAHEGETVTAFVAAPRRSAVSGEGTRVIGGLRDIAGNPLADAAAAELRQEVAWSFVVRRSALRFSPTNAMADLGRGEPGAVTARLANTSEASHRVRLTDLPAWLRPRLTAGLDSVVTEGVFGVLPGGGELPFTFDVDPTLAPGRHRDTLRVDALTPEGAVVGGTLARLFVEAAVGCHAPTWSVAAAAYEHSMQIVARARTPRSGDPAATGLDRDADYAEMTRGLVGVFSGGSLRGVAGVDGQGRAALQAYSGTASGEILRFELWDEENCVRYAEAGPGLAFSSGQTVGTRAAPADVFGVVPARTPGAVVLDAGWTWFSLPYVPSDPALTSVLAPVTPADGDLVRGPLASGETATASYDAAFGVWAGSLAELAPGRGYQVRLSRPAELVRPDGAALADPSEPLSLIPGWNHVGYLPGCAAPVNEALAGLSPAPSAGDVIRSQEAFAVFDAASGWYGSLGELAPGEGYLLRVRGGGTLTYPTDRQPVGGTCGAPTGESAVASAAVPAGAFEHAMSVVVAVPGLSAPADSTGGFEVVAVAEGADGPELRGAARLGYDAERGEHFAFLTVHGHGADAEAVRLRLVRAGTDAPLVVEGGEVRPAAEPAVPTPFEASVVLGTPALPMDFDGYALTARATTAAGDAVPTVFEIVHGAPNPARDRTTIRYALPTASRVRLVVYDVLGRQVVRVVDEARAAGVHDAELDVRGLAAGSYAVILTAADGAAPQRSVLRLTVVR